MNAKKIMGAVLVALLAAALFVGAGAAAVENGQTVFVYQNVSGLNGTWVNGVNTITANPLDGGAAGYFSGDNIVEGTYKQGDLEITVKYPTASISGVAVDGQTTYSIIGGTIYDNAKWANFTVAAAAKVAVYDVLLTLPNGEKIVGSTYLQNLATEKGITNPAGYMIIGGDAKNGTYTFSLNDTVVKAFDAGTYKIQALFSKYGQNIPGQVVPEAGQLIASTPDSYLAGKDVFTFTVAKKGDVTIAADVESVLAGKIVTITVTGQPGETYNITGDLAVDSFGTVKGNKNPAAGIKANFTMPNDGKAVLYMLASGSGNKEVVIELASVEKASVTVDVTKGSITAKTEKESYFIGNAVTISGTSTAADELVVYIKGTNVKFQNLTDKDGDVVTITVANDDTWEEELTADELEAIKDGQKNKEILDAGTYTLYLISTTNEKVISYDNLSYLTYTTVPLVLKQPFISVTDAPAVAVIDTDYKVTGTAEAAKKLAVYIFGTNFYAATNGTDAVTGTILSDESVKIDGNEFTVKFTVPTSGMAAGQYFMVIQHPMYDENFNIYSDAAGNINLTNNGQKTDAKILFNVYKRQTANAAQALCDALETEDIDDMYVKLSFVVAAPTSTINPIPAEITKGSKLTISGTTNLGEGEVVTVEMLSTAFAAVPKDTVGSAAFATVMTKTDKDGNWEVTIDTTDMNVDEYTVSVAVGTLDKTTAKINIIEGAPTEQPTENPTEQPTQTQQPTEAPTTPGFGALAALAGLGAVAVLLLRRE